MNIEIREDSQYTFTYEKIHSDLPQLITAATIAIYSPGGDVILEETSMSVAINVATYNIDVSIDLNGIEFALDKNYRVQYNIDGEVITYFFDIVRFPFVNPVNDIDLVNENQIVRKGVAESRGQADSGTIDTLIDTERTEPNEYWYGGQIEILNLTDTSQPTIHQINDYDSTTNTFTFTPARSSAITTENYILRRSYQASINVAGVKVQEDLLKNSKRAYLLLDSTQCKTLIIYKFFENYFQQLREVAGDKYDLQFNYYKDKYQNEINSIPFIYDENDDGEISTDEEAQTNQVIELIR